MAAKTVQVQATMGSGFEITCKTGTHTVIIDQPTTAGGGDAGPTPLQYFFVALAGCIGSIGRIVAMQKRIELRGMEIEVEGDLDVAGLLGKPTESRVGFTSIRARVSVDADLSVEEKEAFLEEVERRCPVSENVSNTTPVKVTLA